MYAGDYDGAEKAYLRLVAAHTPGAAAHYSTLLAYENRFDEAIGQARDGIQVRADSESYARLCRALDWADQVSAGLEQCRRAVATKPLDPLARPFLAEALADAGRLAEARAQLEQAEALPGDAAVRAEIDRDWSLYDNDRGDAIAQLNHILLAAREQPDFPQRQIAVARFDSAHGRPKAGSALLTHLAGTHPRDYGVLLAVADSTLLGGDAAGAAGVYDKALQARPGGESAAVSRAELATLSQDYQGARSVLLTALTANPAGGAAYQYLSQLDSQVLKRDPGPDLAPAAAAAASLAGDTAAVLARVNSERAAAGVSPLAADPALTKAAQAHAYYYLFNLADPAVAGAGILLETPGRPGFTGADALARARAHGYQGAAVREAAGHLFSPAASVDAWIAGVGQRYPLLSRQAVGLGFGEARAGLFSISLLDVGQGPDPGGDVVVQPASGAAAVPAFYNGGEVPDPLPSGTGYPVGYPVSMQVGSGQRLTLTSAQLVDAQGVPVPTITVSPGSGLEPGEAAMVARTPLQPGSRYSATFNGTLDGAPFTRSWSFQVIGP